MKKYIVNNNIESGIHPSHQNIFKLYFPTSINMYYDTSYSYLTLHSLTKSEDRRLKLLIRIRFNNFKSLSS